MDQYARTLVIKLYTLAWLPHWETILPLFREALQPERVVLRLSRHVAEQAPGRFGCSDGEVVWGTPLAGPVVFTETGLKFQADVLRGQKTGFFLDQRENRRRVGSLAEGRRVLNLFSFSGGFSLYAAQGGASDVLDVDISAHALKAGEANFELNRSVPGIAQCRRRAVRADTFEWLQASTDELYDLVVVDPPSLARRESERPGALQAYRRLAEAAIQRLTPGGVLVAASCSAHVAAPEFFKVVREAAQGSGRRRDELGTTLEPPDHPATFLEAAYLKCIYLRLGGARWK